MSKIYEQAQNSLKFYNIDYEQSVAGNRDAKSLNELRRIADTADRHARLAEREAAAAKKDSRFSKVASIISITIALASLAFSAFSFFLR